MPIAEQVSSTSLDLTWVRSQFPSLAQTVNGHPAVFLDGPGGTQVPPRVIDAISDYLAVNNANSGGAKVTNCCAPGQNGIDYAIEVRAAKGRYADVKPSRPGIVSTCCPLRELGTRREALRIRR